MVDANSVILSLLLSFVHVQPSVALIKLCLVCLHLITSLNIMCVFLFVSCFLIIHSVRLSEQLLVRLTK